MLLSAWRGPICWWWRKEVLGEEHRGGSSRAVVDTRDVGKYTMEVVAGLQYMLFPESIVLRPFLI